MVVTIVPSWLTAWPLHRSAKPDGARRDELVRPMRCSPIGERQCPDSSGACSSGTSYIPPTVSKGSLGTTLEYQTRRIKSC